MAKVPSIPPDYQSAFFDSVAYSGDRPPSYFTDDDWKPITGQDHLEQIYTTAREKAAPSFDENTDPGLGAANTAGQQPYVDEEALRADPSTRKRYDAMISGKKPLKDV